MIKVNELRVGNWYIDEKGEYQNVGHIQNNFYGTLINGNNYFLFPEMINPIPLTPEILEKAEFELKSFINEAKQYDGECFVLKYLRPKEDTFKQQIVLIKHDKIYGYAFCVENFSNDFKVSITTIINLHQLQNLYFALTGEELNIQL